MGTVAKATAGLEDFARHATGQGAPAVVMHVRSGTEETAKALGVSDLGFAKPAQTSDKLWISGAGTPMVAVSVLKLAEEGRVSLDAPVADYLPEFAVIFPSWRRSTIRELLGSRTGLPDYVPSLVASMPADKLRTTGLTYEQRLRIAADGGAPPVPVAQAAWSATDWEVLAWLLERVRGQALADILQAEVFGPAGMSHSLVAPLGPPPEPMLHGYVMSAGNRLDLTRIDAFSGSGDAGVISTAEDVGKFFTALMTGRLVGDEMRREMVQGSSYRLGGFLPQEDICPDTQHVFASGGGGPYSLLSASSLDGTQLVTAAMVLPPAELDSTRIPPLVTRLEEAVRSTARALCSPS